MNTYWHLSWRRLLSRLMQGLTLTAVLLTTSCILDLSPEALRTVTPMAEVEVSPALFCPGEILTVTWDGGGQVNNCAEDVDVPGCKAGTLQSDLAGLGFARGFGDFNLGGTASAVAIRLMPYNFSYQVDWVGWAGYRAYRSRLDIDGETIVTGLVQDRAVAAPLAGNWSTAPRFGRECDETGHWVSRVSHVVSPPIAVRHPEEGDLLRGFPSYLPGDVSACVGSAQICIHDIHPPDGITGISAPVVVSVAGGPTVTLGGTDDLGSANPRCTDAFAGYNPLDLEIHYTSDDSTECTPGTRSDSPAFAYPVDIQLAGGDLCATGPGPDGFYLTEDDYSDFGDVELLGVSRDRCIAALDPGYLARFGPTEDASGVFEPDDAQCDLNETCGDGFCNPFCEDEANCAEDCAPTEGVTTPVCGDGILAEGEECEGDNDCAQDYYCGNPDTGAPCVCVLISNEQPAETAEPEEPAETAGYCEYFPVHDCVEVGPNLFQWYGVTLCYDEEGNGISREDTDGPHQGGWQPGCPAFASPGGGQGQDGQSSGGSYCGDGTCDPGESGCGVCSADCGPC